MSEGLDISVLVATYNRSGDLCKTLEAFEKLDLAKLHVEFVIIDNNSDDGTRALAESFAGRLPMRYLFVPEPGKNCALNRAVSELELGDIVVFTDDDVDPCPDWLLAVQRATAEWPDAAAFGGRIDIVWPEGPRPRWSDYPMVQEIGFCRHAPSAEPSPYPPGLLPFGANCWMRRWVFDSGRRFDENVGPRPKNRIMGSETSLLTQLAGEGHDIIHVPQAAIGHRLQPELIDAAHIRRRAFRLGRQGPHIAGLPREQLLSEHPVVWHVLRWFSFKRGLLICLRSRFSFDPRVRFEKLLVGVQVLAYNIEAVRLARNRKP